MSNLLTQIEVIPFANEQTGIDVGVTVRPAHNGAHFQLMFCFGEKKCRRRRSTHADCISIVQPSGLSKEQKVDIDISCTFRSFRVN